jgi:hypothetical protein
VSPPATALPDDSAAGLPGAAVERISPMRGRIVAGNPAGHAHSPTTANSDSPSRNLGPPTLRMTGTAQRGRKDDL